MTTAKVTSINAVALNSYPIIGRSSIFASHLKATSQVDDEQQVQSLFSIVCPINPQVGWVLGVKL